jgi:hypothetical protein
MTKTMKKHIRMAIRDIQDTSNHIRYRDQFLTYLLRLEMELGQGGLRKQSPLGGK